MRKFLKFVHDDVVYCIYYEVVDILFHIGSELPAKECIIVQFNRCATCNILLESPEINFRTTRDFVELLKQVFG